MGFYRGPRIVTDGLVMYLDAANPKSYPGTGVVWNDLSKNGNGGTLINSPSFNSGNGGSIVFDGVNDYVNVPSLPSPSQNMTFSLWFNPTLLPSATSNQILYIQAEDGYTIRLYKNTSFPQDELSWLMYYEKVDLSIGFVLPQYTYPLNTWTHTLMTFNDTGEYKVYINGVLWNTTQASTFVKWKLPNGFLRLSGPTGGFLGGIQQLQIYNRALSLTEIQQNYNATKSRFGL